MNENFHQASICSIIYIEIIDLLNHSETVQTEVKNKFHTLVHLTLKDVSQGDYTVLDTHQGVVIAYKGQPEYAMYIAMNIRDRVLRYNTRSLEDLLVRFGVHLGLLSMTNSTDEQPKFIGEGVEVVQLILQRAKTYEVFVSHTYYDVIVNLTPNIAALFEFSLVSSSQNEAQTALLMKHTVYSAHLLANSAIIEARLRSDAQGQSLPVKNQEKNAGKLPSVLNSYEPDEDEFTFFSAAHWKYTLTGILALAGLYMLIQMLAKPADPTITLAKPEVIEAPVVVAKVEEKPVVTADPYGLMPNESIEELPLSSDHDSEQVADVAVVKKEVKESKQQAKTATDKLLKEVNVLENNATQNNTEVQKGQDEHVTPVEKPKQEATIQAKTSGQATEQAALSAPSKPTEQETGGQAKEMKATEESAKPEAKVVQAEVKKEPAKTAAKEKTGWFSSFKQGEANPCSQAEQAMNQCR